MYFRPIFDLFYVFGVSGPLGGLLLLNCRPEFPLGIDRQHALHITDNVLSFRDTFVYLNIRAEKSTLRTDASVGQNLQRDLGAIGPREFQGKSVWTNLGALFSGKIQATAGGPVH